MKKKILFAYTFMMIGGSTTSLISLLQNIDYSKYDVDLLLMKKGYPLDYMIPNQVNVLEPALTFKNKRAEFLGKIASPRSAVYILRSRLMPKILKKYHAGAVKSQLVNKSNAMLSRRIDQCYDCAISFIESWPTEYVAYYVKSKKKIAWYHLDYIAAGFYPKYDRKTYAYFDKIVLVSDQCKANFDSIFPEYTKRTVAIENILTSSYIEKMSSAYAQEIIQRNPGRINLITVCRISFKHKGIDRGVRMIKEIVSNNDFDENVNWYIIGDGEDYISLSEIIKQEGLEQYVHLLGAIDNPLPYVKAADLFFLPSRFEGKPMAVTEAFLCGIPVLVTNYASAKEQVKCGFDGLVVDNSEQGIYAGLFELITNPAKLQNFRDNVLGSNYSNVEEIKKVEEMLDD